MKKMCTADLKRIISDLDRIRITQKFSYDTAICGTDKDKNLKGDLSFSFSLLKGLIAVLVALAGICALCCAYRSSLKKKLTKKLKKKFGLEKAPEKTKK